jgi:hypothetical protein
MRNLIWGNPYFDKGFIDPDLAEKFIYPNLLQNYVTKLPQGERGLLFLYPFPPSEEKFSEQDIQVLTNLKSEDGVLKKVAERLFLKLYFFFSPSVLTNLS